MAKDKEWTMDTIVKKSNPPAEGLIESEPEPQKQRKVNPKESKMAKNGNSNGKKELISVDMPFDRDTKGFFVYSRSDKKLFPVYIPRALVDDKAPSSITVTITVGT